MVIFTKDLNSVVSFEDKMTREKLPQQAIDFDDINQRLVGYRLKANAPGQHCWLESVTFEQFIPPYSVNASSRKEIYINLEQSLKSAIEQQNSVVDRKRQVMLDVLAGATLEREAMINSMILIKGFYL